MNAPARPITQALPLRRMTACDQPGSLPHNWRRAALPAGALMFLLSVVSVWPVPAQALSVRPFVEAVRQQLTSGSGFFRSEAGELLLAPDGHFRHAAALAPDGSGPWLGTWSFNADSGDLCLMPLPVQVALLAGGRPGKRPQAVHYSAALARAGLVADGATFDGPAQLKALAETQAVDIPANGREAGAITLDRGARFIHVAVPVRRENREVIYATYRFPVARDAAVYRIVLSGVSAHGAPPHPLAGCRPLAAFGLFYVRGLEATERTALQTQIQQALAVLPAEPDYVQGLPGAQQQQSWRRIQPQDTGRFSVPQTSVRLTVGRRQPDLYQAATDALTEGGPAFSQDRTAAQVSRPDERVLGTAAGLQSPADFDVDMRLLGEGRLDIAVLSRRTPMEINEERARSRELFDRVLNAFPMLAPGGPRSKSPSSTQDKKP